MKKDYFLIDPREILDERHILDTEKGETRFFLFEDDIPIKATAPEKGGLDIYKYVGGNLVPGTDIIPRLLNGADLEEIDEARFQELTSPKA